jgi:aldose 1-epimerase
VPDEIVVVTSDDVRLEVISSVGARVHRLQAFGHDLLRTPASTSLHASEPFFWGGYLMAPWCNRAPAGRWAVGSRSLDLEPNFPDGTAIHGLVHDRPWTRTGPTAWRIERPAGRWPWRHAVGVVYSVVGRRVVIDLAVENHDDEPMPAGIGWHPWFRAPLEVTIPAAAVFESNIGSSAAPVPVSGGFDRRARGPLPPGIDASWTQLAAPQVELGWPALDIRATLTMSDPNGFVVAAAPADLDAVAVEVQTHGPDPIRRLVDDEVGAPTRLAPGAELALRIELDVSPPGH